MPDDALLELEIPELTKVKSGKVREVFDLGEHFLFVASDRISAFDVIMPNGIPRKGEVLTQISHFWFDKYADLVPNHRVANGLPDHLAHLASRSMVVKKAEPLEIECIVRGYIAGSSWKEYQRDGTVCGIQLPENLLESAELEQPLFTLVNSGISSSSNASLGIGGSIPKAARRASRKHSQPPNRAASTTPARRTIFQPAVLRRDAHAC